MASCAPRINVFEKILKFLFIIFFIIKFTIFVCFCLFLSFSVCSLISFFVFFSFYPFLSLSVLLCLFMCPSSEPHGMDSCTPRFGVLKQYLHFYLNILDFKKLNLPFVLVFYCLFLFFLYVSVCFCSFLSVFYPFLWISIHLCPHLSFFVHSCAFNLAHMEWLHVRHEFEF